MPLLRPSFHSSLFGPLEGYRTREVQARANDLGRFSSAFPVTVKVVKSCSSKLHPFPSLRPKSRHHTVPARTQYQTCDQETR
jgi:hypothetical protein